MALTESESDIITRRRGGGIVDGEEEEKQEDGWSISSHEYFVVSFVFAVFKGILNLSVSVRFQADWRSNSPPTVSIVAVRVLVALNRHAAAAPMKCIIAHCAEFLMHCLPSISELGKPEKNTQRVALTG